MGRFREAAAGVTLFSVTIGGTVGACTSGGETTSRPAAEATATAQPTTTGEACDDAATDVDVISGLGGAAVKFKNTGRCFKVYIDLDTKLHRVASGMLKRMRKR
jgi:hypothetical protein